MPDKEALLDELLGRLQDYCPSLYFEVGGAPDGPHELVLSASGDLEAFPCVLALANSSPLLSGWEVIAFKQPQGFEFTTELRGIVLNPRECWFLPVPNRALGKRHWLRIACPGFKESAWEDFAFAVWTALDTGLGEVAVAQQILEIELCATPRDPYEQGFRPVLELCSFLRAPSADVFDESADVEPE